ncbi:MAG TPA: efflux RND transporter periplasmic adaptor subunit [Steroidobacteraceae bacterium]
MDPTNHSLERRALPVRRQAHLLLLLAAAAAFVFTLGWGTSRLLARPSADRPTAIARNADEVHLSEAQLATLTIKAVTALDFHSERVADGKIALNSDTATQVFSPYSGRVIRLLAGLGEHVARGAPLFSIDASEFAQAQSDLLNASSQLKLARISEQRRHAAYDSKGGSLQDWQQAQAELAAAGNALSSVRNRLRILGQSAAQIAALEQQQTPNPITNVVAPIDGIVTDRQVGPGQYLQAGSSTAVYTIGNLSSVWLVADVREVDAPLIEVGQEVQVRVLALPGKIFHAKLASVGATVDPVTRRVPVRATLENPTGKLKPEMFASFSIITSPDTTAPAVPEEAVVREGVAAHVWVVRADNGLVLRAIRTGRIHDGMVEVLGGLKSGERIVTRGSLFIDRAAQPG